MKEKGSSALWWLWTELMRKQRWALNICN